MKRSQLIEYGIIVTGLLFGYKFLDNLFTLIIQVVFSYDTGEVIGSFLVKYIPILIAYFVAFIMLIKRSGQIATYLIKDNSNEIIQVKISKKSVLEVIIICLALFTIISNIADIIMYLYHAFKKEAGRRPDDSDINYSVGEMRFRIAAIQTVAAIFILFYYRQVSNWFLKKNEAEELIFESEEKQ